MKPSRETPASLRGLHDGDEDSAGNDETFEEVHELLFNALVLLVVVHVLAAVKHRFVDRLRDKTRVAT